ncbi:MAG: GreA/GreB family elongation factor [Halarcobacter ebronensis]
MNFGSCVKLLNLETEEEKTFCIVGTYETNPNENLISNKSPLGRALLSKELNEEFEFTINNETYEYEVIEIKKYEYK